MSRLALVALVYFGPVALVAALLLMRRWLRNGQRGRGVPVDELIARVERERAAEDERTRPLRRRQRDLPAGWVWPSRDPDGSRPRTVPVRVRRYIYRFDLGPENSGSEEDQEIMSIHQLDDSPGYVYETMARHLAGRIESGELAPNTPLPSERALAQEYGVSLGTARHATRLLRYRGLVVTIRSKGTYIASGQEARTAHRSKERLRRD